ncbi:phosphoglycerate kinase [Roseiconus lacunae]|uniref:phosphoglycerate kinase n=1 Tax=Roseiconus lacunae TaxID=2605694 RepID=UPI0030865CAE|nr:phosphoglycerate kinase [Stieleria sp. HD01]
MGLDMYAMATKESVDVPVDFKIADTIELHYWRKHPDLHGWMEQLYYAKGGKHEFNCVPVTLDSSDLDRLEAVIRSRNLPATEGFFFGSSIGDEMEDDLAFVKKAREYLSRGYTVFYDAWW